jgi:predicted RNA-binding protein with EMAP domain
MSFTSSSVICEPLRNREHRPMAVSLRPPRAWLGHIPEPMRLLFLLNGPVSSIEDGNIGQASYSESELHPNYRHLQTRTCI